MANLPETPLTRLEQYWAGILDKIEGGGGSNPNYVETITGTLANPWGVVRYSELKNELANNNASCKLVIDATSIGFDIFSLLGNTSTDGAVYFELIATGGSTVDVWAAISVNYNIVGELTSAFSLIGGNAMNISVYPNLPTTLTIIHHQLPNQS